jgi:hypothetical protein
VAGYTSYNGGDVAGFQGGYYDMWVVKLSPDGSGTKAPGIQWQKCLGGSGTDYAYNVTQTTDRGYIVVGYTDSNDKDLIGVSNHGGGDMWVVRLNVADGTTAPTIQWQKCLGGSGHDEGYSVQQTDDGGYIVAGSTESNNGNVSGNHGGTDMWIVKLTSTGSISWQKCLGGSGNEEAYSILKTTDGGYIVVGSTESNNGDLWLCYKNFGTGYDYWVLKLDGTGNILWQKFFGGSKYDLAQSIHLAVDGSYIIAGYTFSNDGNVSGNHGKYDCWVVKMGVPPTP